MLNMQLTLSFMKEVRKRNGAEQDTKKAQMSFLFPKPVSPSQRKSRHQEETVKYMTAVD